MTKSQSPLALASAIVTLLVLRSTGPCSGPKDSGRAEGQIPKSLFYWMVMRADGLKNIISFGHQQVRVI